ncbi:MAG TPA: hypothetical protein VFV90_03945 [Usitatibacter sp.]|nr:hypothetical protein [Usitatibacter sp.]
MRHFLYLTNTRLVSITTQGRRIAARREFAVSGAGITEFEHHVARHQPAPTHFFVDVADEDFRLDTIPHVGGGDRAAVLARKLQQIFRNTPYRYAQMQGREAEGRRDDRVLYTAVTNPESLRPWLDVLDRLKAPLEGLYSAAVFSSVLLEELDLDFPHTLLVTFTPGEAMRQTYFKGGEIKFSRLTPLDFPEGQGLGAFVAEETMRTWQYLDSLRHFGPEDRLEACVLIHANDRAGVQPQLRDFAQLQYRALDIEQASMKLGLRPPPLDSTCEEVMVHLFLLRAAENHFATAEQRRHAVIRRARSRILQASGAILATGLLWGGYHVAVSLQGAEAEDRVEQQLAAVQREHDEIVRSTPSLGVGGSTMRDTVSFYNGWLKTFPALSGFVSPLSGVIARHPGVRVTQLSWMATDDAKATPPMSTPAALRQAPPVKTFAKSSEPAPVAQAATPAAAFAGGRYEIALLEATVSVPADDFRGAIGQAQMLADDIGRLPGTDADVVESPLDVRSSLQLQGRLDTSQPATMEARFVLRVVRDRGGPA